MRIALAGIVIAALLSGCAGSAYSIAHESADQLHTRSDFELCAAYHAERTESVEQELRARKALSDDEWRMVKAGSVAVGMSKAAVVCSWGFIAPGLDGEINRTVTAGGVSEQWVYRNPGEIRARYVYFDNEVVTAIQD